jgi:hypothetical protein
MTSKQLYAYAEVFIKLIRCLCRHTLLLGNYPRTARYVTSHWIPMPRICSVR